MYVKAVHAAEQEHESMCARTCACRAEHHAHLLLPSAFVPAENLKKMMGTSNCLVTRATDEHSTPIYPPSATHRDPVQAVRDLSHSAVVRGATGCMYYTSSDAGGPLCAPIVNMCMHRPLPTFVVARVRCCTGAMTTPRAEVDAGALRGSVMLADGLVAVSMSSDWRELRTLSFKRKHRDETITFMDTDTGTGTSTQAFNSARGDARSDACAFLLRIVLRQHMLEN